MRKGQIHPCRLPDGEAAFRQLIRTYKTNAKDRGYEWALPEETVRALVSQPCYYCGLSPEKEVKIFYRRGHVRDTFRCNGIDRVDNRVGYTVANSVACCKQCNHAKRDMSLADFRAFISRVYGYMNGAA